MQHSVTGQTNGTCGYEITLFGVDKNIDPSTNTICNFSEKMRKELAKELNRLATAKKVSTESSFDMSTYTDISYYIINGKKYETVISRSARLGSCITGGNSTDRRLTVGGSINIPWCKAICSYQTDYKVCRKAVGPKSFFAAADSCTPLLDKCIHRCEQDLF